jgi:hypothetical protein
MLGNAVIQAAQKLLYVRERTNHNDAPEIDKILAWLGLPKGLAWCLAFCLWSWHQVVTPFPFPKIARCATFWEETQDNEWRFKTFTPEDISWGTAKAQAGDIGIFAHNPNGKKNWDGHAVLIERQLTNTTFKTIEGNTVAGPGGSVAEQRGTATTGKKQGVYERVRSVGGKTFPLEGFVRSRRLPTTCVPCHKGSKP